MKKRISIEVDEATFSSAYDAYEVALKQKGTEQEIIFYAAEYVWRDNETGEE